MSFLNTFTDRFVFLLPIILGLGLHVFFQAPSLPIHMLLISLFISLICVIFTRKSSYIYLSTSVLVFILGVNAAALKTHTTLNNKTPNVSLPWKGSIHAEIESIETTEGQLRLILKNLSGKNFTLKKARVNFKHKKNAPPEILHTLQPGQHIKTYVGLFPIPPQETPLNYDFEFFAFFQGLEAIGFGSLNAIKITKETNTHVFEWLRHTIAHALRHNTSSQNIEIAIALITGHKFGISQKNRDNFANSGLAHLLAISGLHLSLITGLMFLVFRKGLSLFSTLALYWPLKKVAAVLALGCSLFYLNISGGSLPTLRAFIMATFIILGVLFNRDAISLRSVAIAACVVLISSPEALYSPSFQMSFAAVTCLIAAYEHVSTLNVRFFSNVLWARKAIQYLLGAVISSLIATLATLPFIIYTFHRFSWHSIEANLIAIPLMTFFIMPLAILVVLLLPVGLHALPLTAMLWGIDILIHLAATISSLSGSFVPVHPPHTLFLPLVLFGVFWFILIANRAKWAGLCVAFSAFLLPPKHVFLLVSQSKQNVGILTSDGSLITSTGRQSFVNKDWQNITTSQAIIPIKKASASWVVPQDSGWRITPFQSAPKLSVFIQAQSGTPIPKTDPVIIVGFPLVSYVLVNGTPYSRGGLALWKDYNDAIHVMQNDTETTPWRTAPTQ